MTKKTFTLDGIQDLRSEGLYFLYKDGKIVYIGVSKNVYVRILEHSFEDKKDFDSLKVLTHNQDAGFIVLEIMEVFLINRLTPKYNKLVVKDIFTYYHTLPSPVSVLLGKDNFKSAEQLSSKFIEDLKIAGFKK